MQSTKLSSSTFLRGSGAVRTTSSTSHRVVPRGRFTWVPVIASWNAPVEWAGAKIVKSQKAAEGLQTLVVDIGARAAGFTRGGQYVQFKVGDSKPAFIAVASGPEPNNQGAIELLVKNAGGTSELLVSLKPGDALDCSPVQGKGFPVEKAPVEAVDTVLLFATGSGISPIRALIESGALDAKKRKKVKLYYGARDLDQMAYRDRFASWEAAGVEVVPVLSKGGDGWTGATGYVQDAAAKDKLADPAKTAVFLVGQKGMVEATKAALTAAGVPAEHFFLNF